MNPFINNWDLIWTGEWELWQGLIVGLVFCLVAWFLYRGELIRGTTSKLRFLLPFLRTLAVFLIILAFCGPTLRTSWEEGERGRVLIFLDSSESMSLKDEHMTAGRKLILAQKLGYFPKDQNLVNFNLFDSAEILRKTSGQINREISSKKPEAKVLLRNVRGNIEQVDQLLAKENQFKINLDEKSGVLLEEVWNGINGSDLTTFLNDPQFKFQNPDQISYLSSASSKENVGDNYLRRLKGFIIPPISGIYTFWIYSDDHSILRLNINGENATNAKQIIELKNAHKGWREDLTSSKIKLTEGRKYFFEVLHKEGSGDDHVAVGWTLPDGTQERPIPGIRFSAPANEDSVAISKWKEKMNKEQEPLLTSLQKSNSFNTETWDKLARSLLKYSVQLQENFDRYADDLLISGNESILSGIKSLEQSNRWNRATSLLTQKNTGILSNLAQTHLLEVRTMSGNGTTLLWENESISIIPTFDFKPIDPRSDLASGIRSTIQIEEDERTSKKNDAQRAAAVLLSDGGHNQGGSPLEISKLLGARNIPIFTVGFGNNQRPPDLAILDVQNPPSIFVEDRVRGTISLKDDLIPGTPFRLVIKDSENLVIWDRNLTGLDLRKREVTFDFPAKPLVDQKLNELGENSDLNFHSIPLRLKVEIEPVEGEAELQNNSLLFSVDAVTRKNRVLLLDDRPRWETRYLKNLFERDERWDTTCVWAGTGSEKKELASGKEGDVFPNEKNHLFTYDLIIYGELEPEQLSSDQQEWIKEFVNKRGGGILFLDGPRQVLRTYANPKTHPIVSLFPVKWKKNGPPRLAPQGFSFNEKANKLPALILESQPVRNQALWAHLPSPAWSAPVENLPSAEVFLYAKLDQNGKSLSPLIVGQKYGAGKAFYAGFDETWKWRYEVGDKYHQRYWNQFISWIMEKPFAVSDQRISLDVGGNTFSTGEKAIIRARIRDKDGMPPTTPFPEVDALLWKNEKVFATIPLKTENETSGLFLGETPTLEEGNYQISLRAPEIIDEFESNIEASFQVKPVPNREKSYLTCNEELLKQMADLSGGQFFPEEQIDQLNEILKPISSGRVVTSELALWQSYWWFVPIFLLLAVELFLRKRAGLL
ncbi:MAG: PA14 domain-containing protein [Opitutae bacterium]